jgi:hypothetical protein
MHQNPERGASFGERTFPLHEREPAMTLHDGTKELFDDLGLDRTDVRVVAKSIAQQIIDDSKQSGSSLSGMVYDVRTLYDEGVPQCEFRIGDDETVRFRAQFHADGADGQVDRQRTISVESLRDLVEQLPTRNAPDSAP